MRWVGLSIVMVGTLSVVTARAESTAARPELPVAVAAFPAEAVPAAVAPAAAAKVARAPVSPPSAAAVAWPAPVMPAWAPPAPVPAAPARAVGDPPSPAAAPVATPPAPASAPLVEPVSLDACPVPRSATDLVTVAIGVLLRDAGSLFSALQSVAAPDDSRVIEHAAGVEVRRIAFMRQLAATREEEDQRACDEKLSLYLRKRAFLQGLEAQQSTPATLPTR